tara:strand:+ start:406 stop:1008 length:603 start_codon:yes stop_codon:yes gene_type:complete
MNSEECIKTRRSVRHFNTNIISIEVIKELIKAASFAPAPHHTKPWRFVIVDIEQRVNLADAMGKVWEKDLLNDGVNKDKILELLGASKNKIVSAPSLIIGCINKSALRTYGEASKDNFEMIMAHHSLGAALQNIFLSAHAKGLASYWISSPLYAAHAVQKVLGYPSDWISCAGIAIGEPKESFIPPTREQVDLEELIYSK